MRDKGRKRGVDTIKDRQRQGGNRGRETKKGTDI